jgi:hypothetical protein
MSEVVFCWIGPSSKDSKEFSYWESYPEFFERAMLFQERECPEIWFWEVKKVD